MVSAWNVERHLKFSAAHDDEADVDRAQVERQPKAIRAAVAEWTLAIPLASCDTRFFLAVDLVRRRDAPDVVHYNPLRCRCRDR